METKLYHCGGEITKIEEDYGLFGRFLFFASEPCHGEPSATVYSVEIDRDSIVDAQSFFYSVDGPELASYANDVMELTDCDEDTAQELLGQRQSVWDVRADADSEDLALWAWEIQRLTAYAALALGYRGVAVPDEHDTSYMIDMLGREAELVKVDY